MSTEVPRPPGSQTSLRQANRERVVQLLRSSGTLTQAEIARNTGLSPATVSNVVRDLRAAGTVGVRATSATGRRARAVSLLREPGMVVALEFGVDQLAVLVADHDQRILAQERIPYDLAGEPERGLRRAAWLAETAMGQARVDRGMVTRGTIAFPGPIDPDTGEVGATTVLPRWSGTRPAAELATRLGITMVAENEANLAAVAEQGQGAARDSRAMVYVHLSHGVGAGIVLDGRLVTGVAGTAGEIGHVTLDERGQVCRCGNRGCLETLAGAPYLLAMVPRPTTDADTTAPATLHDIVRAAQQEDPGCTRVLAEAGYAVGRGVAVLVNVFNPDRVVVGGALARGGELVLEPLRRAVDLEALPSALNRAVVVPGQLADQAALRGAVQYALA
ncbi:ROK family transcriptional regulator [Lipingzhangella sp. LS1_29]|uniref:ROK family transcriptional regulator n=1 Tax=Lipingzhangella rawalii TaxID=2055835 RepID=A0ABU2H6V4_9ACTN|nr:ROK family transcriptional regulator [Lipingzhangella rawalii]MDS1271036.1 ROK family transcriptional regulator [Lipingzhangella rawalii]